MTPAARDRRFFAIRECGCVACLMHASLFMPPQVHHLNFGDKHGGKRLGDEATVGLCPWHHVGEPVNGMSGDECRQRLGPSWQLEPSAFREQFGTGAELLAYQERLIEAWKSTFIGAVA